MTTQATTATTRIPGCLWPGCKNNTDGRWCSRDGYRLRMLGLDLRVVGTPGNVGLDDLAALWAARRVETLKRSKVPVAETAAKVGTLTLKTEFVPGQCRMRGCTAEATKRGFCDPDYANVRRADRLNELGTPFVPQAARQKRQTEPRVDDRVHDDLCWRKHHDCAVKRIEATDIRVDALQKNRELLQGELGRLGAFLNSGDSPAPERLRDRVVPGVPVVDEVIRILTELDAEAVQEEAEARAMPDDVDPDARLHLRLCAALDLPIETSDDEILHILDRWVTDSPGVLREEELRERVARLDEARNLNFEARALDAKAAALRARALTPVPVDAVEARTIAR